MKFSVRLPKGQFIFKMGFKPDAISDDITNLDDGVTAEDAKLVKECLVKNQESVAQWLRNRRESNLRMYAKSAKVNNMDLTVNKENKLQAMLADSRYQDLLEKYGQFHDSFMFEMFNKEMTGQELLLVNQLTDGINTKTSVPLGSGFTDWYELQGMLLVSHLILNPGCRVVVVTGGVDADKAIDEQFQRTYQQCTDLIIKHPWLEACITATRNGFHIDSGSSIIFKKAVPGREFRLAGEYSEKMLTVINNVDCLSFEAWEIVMGAQTGQDNRVLAVGPENNGHKQLGMTEWNVAALNVTQEREA